jgi:hypothetical protein
VAALLQAFWQILLLRKSPAILPYSQVLLAITLLLQLLVAVGFGLLIKRAGSEAISLALLGIGLEVSGSYFLSRLYTVSQRFVQTATAIAGCGIFIDLVALPINLWLFSVDKSSAQLPGLLSLLLIGWGIAVIAHIWSSAFEVPKWVGFLYAISYVIISLILSSLI